MTKKTSEEQISGCQGLRREWQKWLSVAMKANRMDLYDNGNVLHFDWINVDILIEVLH